MDEILYIASFIIFLIGISGSIVPGIPGPFISYMGVVLLYGTTDLPITTEMMWILGFFMVLTTAGDYLLQILGVKKLGGGKKAIRGTIIGTIIGLFIPPIGIIVGALLGAFIGAKSETDDDSLAIKVALGAFVGFVLGTVVKLVYSIYIIYYVITLL
tara:strand:- start:1637 stop:2107 length:471 start_codon:yes stop_codon:yes gene_type:complete